MTTCTASPAVISYRIPENAITVTNTCDSCCDYWASYVQYILYGGLLTTKYVLMYYNICVLHTQTLLATLVRFKHAPSICQRMSRKVTSECSQLHPVLFKSLMCILILSDQFHLCQHLGINTSSRPLIISPYMESAKCLCGLC